MDGNPGKYGGNTGTGNWSAPRRETKEISDIDFACKTIRSRRRTSTARPTPTPTTPRTDWRVAHISNAALCCKSFPLRVPHPFAFARRGEEHGPRLLSLGGVSPWFPPLQRTQGWGTLCRGALSKTKRWAIRPQLTGQTQHDLGENSDPVPNVLPMRQGMEEHRSLC